jgi:MoaA/NifB/PqqE/SkfB family radical SAM enzyme
MYKANDYIKRGLIFANNQLFPSHKKLSTLMIYATDLCDSACKHCFIWAKRPVHFLSFDKIKEVMKSKCITSYTTIGLEGGEFMLHPEAMKILEWFTKNHKNTDLLSNCLQPELLIEAVKKHTPRHLYVSLDGNEETYLYMRGKPGYKNVIKVIEELHNTLPISVMFTLSPYNDFDDLDHVAEICKKYNVDLRVGIYNDIAFFDTRHKAHETEIGVEKDKEPLKYKDVKKLSLAGEFENVRTAKQLEKEIEIHLPKHDYNRSFNDFVKRIPENVKKFQENYDFLVLYNEWRQNNLKLRCYSILDSLVILPDGSVPICQNLDLKLGNIHVKPLDEIFNSTESVQTQKKFVHNCNQCWLNFHRKYDIILYRTFEKYFGRSITSKLFGYYQWEETAAKTYKEYIKESGTN